MNANGNVANAAGGGGRQALRVLMVEDSQPDAELVRRTLERGGFEPECARVETREDMERALGKQQWDVILSDHHIPNFSAPEALELMKEQGLDVPFIIVSGMIEEQTAVTAMHAGAHDYVMKDRLARLVPAVQRELREAKLRQAQRNHAAQLRRAHGELEVRVRQRTADLNATIEKLHHVMEERRRLENELLEIAENERRRIGFDLHDDLGQKLAGVSLMVKGLERQLAAQGHSSAGQAAKIHALLTEITGRLHTLAHQFSSLDAQGDNLPGLLEGLAGNVKRMFEIPCVFESRGAIPGMPPNTALQLYKIAQEAVSNAIKHGQARQVRIRLARGPARLSLTIRNDGRPFVPPVDAKKGMGLRIMKYRAHTIGAELEIRPLRRIGTLVTCLCPWTDGDVANGAANAKAAA